MRDQCLNCGGTIQRIDYASGANWMHVDASASFPSVQKGTAWSRCKTKTAEPARKR